MVNKLGIVVGVLVVATAAHAGPVDSVLCQRSDARFDQKNRSYLSVTRGKATDASADGKLKIGDGGDAGPDALLVVDAATNKVKHTIKSKRDKEYSCGSGIWMGDVILAFGNDCHEFDAMPYLVNGKTGKYIGPLVDKKFTTDGETLFDVAQLDGKLWAVAVYNHYMEDDLGLGKVFVIDVTTGKVTATVQGVKAGGASITEGKATRAVAKVTSCAP